MYHILSMESLHMILIQLLAILGLSYNWSFGDGEYRDSAISTYTFTEPGILEVSLFVIDDNGAQSLTKTITVRVQNPLPIISVRILDGFVDGEQMDRNTLGQADLFPMLGHTHLILQRILSQPGYMLYFDSEGTRDGDEDMKVNIPR